MAGDDEALDLARALADRRQLHVAEILLGGIVLDESVAAMDLHAVLRGADGNLAGIQLRHRRLQRRPLPLILHRGGAEREQPRSLDPAAVLHQLRADALELSNRTTELPTHERIVARSLIGALRQTNRERRDPNASGVEHLQRVDESLPFGAEQLRMRDAAL